MTTAHMANEANEKRRAKRVELRAPLFIRRVDAPAHETDERVTGDISLAGIYFETPDGSRYQANDTVMTSVSIPESERRSFPFTRLAGRCRVVRVHELTPQDPSGSKRFGVALEYGSDLTALTATPSRG